MNTLQAGFGRVDVTPQLGIDIVGYFKVRKAEKVLDPLEINALALGCGEDKVLLMSIDNCSFYKKLCDVYRKAVAEATGVPYGAVLVHCTHTHTGPSLRGVEGGFSEEGTIEYTYQKLVGEKFVEAAKLAVADMKPAKMGYGVGTAPNVAFVRRYRMKDGSVRTNPGVDNPDILHPIGETDERVNVLRFDREDGESLVLLNFGNHPDTVGGNNISADWPGFARRTVEKVLDNTKCIFFNGAQGDVNHVNVHPTGGDLNDMFMDFDSVSRGYGHARYVGRVVAGAALQVFDKVCYKDVDRIRFTNWGLEIPSNMPDPKDLPEAHRIHKLHTEGRDAELPYEGMMLTTMVADAARKVRLENGPASFPMELMGVAVGDVAVVGIPGEPFTGIGRGLKKAEGWDLVLPMCLVNDSRGYFPMRDAYDEGGYEASTSNFKAGVAELLIEEGTKMLGSLK